ncbi:receptor expression-enhancing protein 3 [Herpailurus yagouaroundi]|uniref:receptor expression-enhancing protein 3 n=1 Tax=Herpailurus yagouaroundi TaxID=1608482 RepID=UPI001AD67669|nr:receptor expression-enhancing protein 3 [Puma yagouaroundi]
MANKSTQLLSFVGVSLWCCVEEDSETRVSRKEYSLSGLQEWRTAEKLLCVCHPYAGYLIIICELFGSDAWNLQVRWMMYWIVFALYTVIETITDQTVAWFPLYYELKIAFVIWLLSPYTKGASLIYRKFLHPLLSSKEREIDDYIVQAKERGYETVVNFGRQGLAFAATAAVTAAVKSQGAITERLRSFSMHDLTAIQGDEPVGQRSYQSLQEAKKKSKSVSGESAGYGIPLKDGDEKTDEEAEGPYSDDEMLTHKGLRRSQSMKSVKTVKGRKEVRYGSLKYKVKKRPQVYF